MSDIPCRCCGVATDQRVTWQPDLTTTGRAYGRKYEVGVCDGCVTLRPDEAGSAVRAALRLLGKDEGDWRLAADAFDEAGVDVAPLLYEGETRPLPQRKAWGHVGKDARAALRLGYARLLDFRVHAASDHDRPIPAHAPDPEFPPGCAYCGVGEAEQWVTIRTHSLRRGAGMLTAVLCPACAEATEQRGAVGVPAMSDALMAFRGLDYPDGAVLDGLRPWVALDLDPGEPWEFVGEVREPEPEPTLRGLAAEVAALRREVAELRAGVGK